MKKLFLGLLILSIVLTSSMAYAGDGQWPQIYNLTLTSADTEYSQAITGVKKFTVQCRTSFAVRFAYETGKVAGPTAPYQTIKAGAAFWEDDIIINDTLYFASSEAGVIVEILVYR